MQNSEVLFRDKPIWQAIFSLVGPSILSVLVMVIYNMTDLFFIGMLHDTAQTAAVALVGPEVIDEINILNAAMLAMKQAVEGLAQRPGLVLVDGNRYPPAVSQPGETVVKGDANSASIAAASILAKVSRDRYMEELAEKYPQYCFAQHKGYGTKEHREALREFGPCPLHRMGFRGVAPHKMQEQGRLC